MAKITEIDMDLAGRWSKLANQLYQEGHKEIVKEIVNKGIAILRRARGAVGDDYNNSYRQAIALLEDYNDKLLAEKHIQSLGVEYEEAMAAQAFMEGK